MLDRRRAGARPPPASPCRKRTRLPLHLYAQPGSICSVTFVTLDRRPLFAEAALADCVVSAVREQANDTGVLVYGYCVMPDHVHLLLGPSAVCDVIAFVARVKNVAQRALWAAGVRRRVWQRGFLDRFLRREDDLAAAIRYVLENPVRKGLVRRWAEYRHSGSLLFELGGL